MDRGRRDRQVERIRRELDVLGPSDDHFGARVPRLQRCAQSCSRLDSDDLHPRSEQRTCRLACPGPEVDRASAGTDQARPVHAGPQLRRIRRTGARVFGCVRIEVRRPGHSSIVGRRREPNAPDEGVHGGCRTRGPAERPLTASSDVRSGELLADDGGSGAQRAQFGE